MIRKSSFANIDVLVVDDEPDSIEVITLVFTAAGSNIYQASNGKKAIRIFEEHQPALVIADLSMPEVDGWELLRLIRANSAGLHTPVVALTAHAMERDKVRVLAAGFDGYISKPFQLATFFEDLLDTLGVDNFSQKLNHTTEDTS